MLQGLASTVGIPVAGHQKNDGRLVYFFPILILSIPLVSLNCSSATSRSKLSDRRFYTASSPVCGQLFGVRDF
jgi:hypothetical protein